MIVDSKCFSCRRFKIYPPTTHVLIQKGGLCELHDKPVTSYSTCLDHDPLTPDEIQANIEEIYQRVNEQAKVKMLKGDTLQLVTLRSDLKLPSNTRI